MNTASIQAIPSLGKELSL